MSDRATAFKNRYDALRSDSARLSRALRTAAVHLAEGSLAIDTRLPDEIRACRRTDDELRRDMASVLQAPRAAAIDSLPESLSQLLRRVEQADEERRKAEQARSGALALLDRLLSIQSSDDAAAAALESCRGGARELQMYLEQADASALPPDAAELAAGRHPWCALVSLVEPDEQLDDDRWGQLHDVVATVFGRPLAAAVARRRLVCPPRRVSAAPRDATPATTASEPCDSVPASTPVRHDPATATEPAPVATLADRVASKPAPSKPAQPAAPPSRQPPPQKESAVAPPASRRVDLDSDIDPGASANPPREEAVIVRNNAGPGPKGASAPKSTSASRRTLPSRASLNTVPAIAQAAANAAGRARCEHVARLVATLVLEGRLGLAFHLARSLEQRRDVDVPFLPSSLVHALALSAEVRFPLGESSRQLAADFAKLRTARPPRGDAEWTIAWQLLLTAATLRPALLAPTSNASGVLHGLRMIDGLSRLYNYAHRIAIFGDQSQPLDIRTFKRARSEQAWEYELELLVGEAEAWCSQTPVRRLRYQAATHCFLRSHWSVMRSPAACDPQARDLWRIWQGALDRLHAMLAPVRANRVSEAARVRAETDRLSDPAEVERLVASVGTGRLLAPLDSSSREPLRVLVAEAVGLARRWLRLHDATPDRRPATVPRRAEEVLEERRALQLRDEVLSRQDAVLRELKSIGERNSSATLATGIACCCRAIEQIRRLFDPDEAIAADEADPRTVVHAELLRIPHLTLNELWEPETPPQELENDILQLLARGSMDWSEAFETRCREGDYEATDRLLTLDVWPSETERLRLADVREQRLGDCRAALARDILESRSRIEEALSLGLIQEHDQAQFEAEVAAVESASQGTLRFPPWHRRLNEIRDGLERRRRYEIQRIRDRYDELQPQDAPPPEAAKGPVAFDRGTAPAPAQEDWVR